jgi:hypothetical protein
MSNIATSAGNLHTSLSPRLLWQKAVLRVTMIKQLPGLRSVSRLFGTRSAEQRAQSAMSRVLSQLELEVMPYESGLCETRRSEVRRRAAIGIWLLELPDEFVDEELLLQNVVPAVTSDLRNDGFGILMTKQLTSGHVMVAIPDKEGVWKYFATEVRYQSSRPGGWNQIGLKIERLVELNALQVNLFRSRTTPDETATESAEECTA